MRQAEVYKLTQEPDENLGLIGVYGIKSILTDRYYVGSTGVVSDVKRRGFAQRWRDHYHNLKYNKHHSKYLQNHVNKYGIKDLEFVILEALEDPKSCRIREKHWIDCLDSYNNGFNCSLEADNSISGETHPLYIKVDREKIKYLYTYKKLSLKKISKIIGVSSFKVSRILQEQNIPLENNLTVLPIKEIYYRHNLGSESLKNLSKEFEVPDSTIRRQFKRYGFKHRMELLDEKLPEIKQYYKNGGNIVEYCKKLPYSHDSVYRRLQNEKK